MPVNDTIPGSGAGTGTRVEAGSGSSEGSDGSDAQSVDPLELKGFDPLRSHVVYERPEPTNEGGRLIIVSNRAPADDPAKNAGGLVVALLDFVSSSDGLWFGTSGDTVAEASDEVHEKRFDGYTRLTIDLSEKEQEGYYFGYANSVLWPLFHGRSDLLSIRAGYEETYKAVNQRMARIIADYARPEDTIWVQDYHFLPLARYLRAYGVECRIGFFLHIPVPPAQTLMATPRYRQFIDWFYAYDLVGLHAQRDVNHLLDFFRTCNAGQLMADGSVRSGAARTRVASFPIGINVEAFAKAARESVEGGRHAERASIGLGPDEKMVLGVDRLDYSKGLPQRMKGFRCALNKRRPDMGRLTLIQIATPSREAVQAYQDIRHELERLSGEINGAYSEIDWTPLRYIHRHIPRERLVGLYRAAHVGLVTPLMDGMNLVAKEYVAAQNPDDPGVLILSQFAGAAEQMREALIVNPHDVDEIGRAIIRAATMPLPERRARHAALFKRIAEEDIDWWRDNFLAALAKQPRNGVGDDAPREAQVITYPAARAAG